MAPPPRRAAPPQQTFRCTARCGSAITSMRQPRLGGRDTTNGGVQRGVGMGPGVPASNNWDHALASRGDADVRASWESSVTASPPAVIWMKSHPRPRHARCLRPVDASRPKIRRVREDDAARQRCEVDALRLPAVAWPGLPDGSRRRRSSPVMSSGVAGDDRTKTGRRRELHRPSSCTPGTAARRGLAIGIVLANTPGCSVPSPRQVEARRTTAVLAEPIAVGGSGSSTCRA